jgi:hypothetical protein
VDTHPDLAFESYSLRASAAVQALTPYVASARSLIQKATERKTAGELNETTFAAECAPSNVVILLTAKLDALLIQAKNSKDVLALRCVNMAAITLKSYADSNLKGVECYPNDSEMATKLVDQTLARAKGVYAAVVDALGDIHQNYGIQLPPAAPI